jgi:hypothetical protein
MADERICEVGSTLAPLIFVRVLYVRQVCFISRLTTIRKMVKIKQGETSGIHGCEYEGDRWNFAPCSLIEVYRRLHHEGDDQGPDDGGGKHL